jgi:hypothetical protein
MHMDAALVSGPVKDMITSREDLMIYIWFGKCTGTMDDKATQKKILHALADSYMQSRHFFCKHAARTII